MSGWPLLTLHQATSERPAYWPLIVRAMVEDKLRTLNEFQVIAGIESGRLQVVWDGETVLVFSLIVPLLHVIYATGTLATLRRWQPIAERWARLRLCTGIRVMGRPGWSKVLGYDVLTTLCGKTL